MFGPNGLPEIDIALDIDGRGATIRRRQSAVCSEQGTPPFRLFYVAGALSPGLGQGSLTLRNLTLAGGFSFGAAGGAAQITDPVKGRASFGGGGGAAGLGGAIFAHGSVVLSAVSVVDSCAQGGMGGLGLAESKYGGGGGGGLGGAGGSPVATEPSNVSDSKYGGGGGGFRTSGGSAGQGGVFLVDGARPDKPAGAYGAGESAVPLKTVAEPGDKGTASASAVAATGGLGGGSRGLGGLGGAINLIPGRYGGDGGSGGQLAGSSGTCGAGGGAGFGGDGGQYVQCFFVTGTLPRAAAGGGAFGGGGGGGDGRGQDAGGGVGGGGGDGRGPGGGGGVGGGGGGAGLGGDMTLAIGGGGGGFGGGGGGGGARGGNGGFGGGGGAGEEEPGLPGFGGGAGTRSTDCVVGGQAGTGGGGGGLGAGGAIFVHGGSLSAANSTFANNRARGGAASGGKGTCAESGHGFGGALFSLNGMVTLVNVSAVANEVGGVVANSGGGEVGPGVISFDDGRAFVSVSLGSNDAAASLTLQNTLISSNAGAPSTAGDVVLLAKSGTSTLLSTAPNLMEQQPKSMRDTGGVPTPAKLVAETSGVRLGTVQLQVSGGLYAPQDAASGLLSGDAATCQQAPVSGVDQRGVARSPSACTLGAVETIPYTRPESPPCVPTSPGCAMTPVGPANASRWRLLVAASFALSTLLLRRRRRSRGAYDAA